MRWEFDEREREEMVDEWEGWLMIKNIHHNLPSLLPSSNITFVFLDSSSTSSNFNDQKASLRWVWYMFPQSRSHPAWTPTCFRHLRCNCEFHRYQKWLHNQTSNPHIFLANPFNNSLFGTRWNSIEFIIWTHHTTNTTTKKGNWKNKNWIFKTFPQNQHSSQKQVSKYSSCLVDQWWR